MSRQVVIDLGGWTLKLGLWEQSFLPSLELPACFTLSEDGQRVFSDEVFDPPGAIRPIERGHLKDGPGLEALLTHSLRKLGLMEPWSDVLCLFGIPAGWSPAARMALCRIAMDGLGFGGIYLADQPVLACWAVTLNTALVVDVGASTLSVSAVLDGKVAVHEVQSSEADMASLMNCVIEQCEAERRPVLWDSVVLTGLASRRPNLRSELDQACQPFLAISTFHGDHQADTLRFRAVPEYYHEVHQRALPLAAWFGGGIVAKTVFGESKAFWSAADWQQHREALLRIKPL